MALNFTVLNQEMIAIQGTDMKQATLEMLSAEKTVPGKIKVSLKNASGESVKFNQVFSTLKLTAQSTNHTDIGPVEAAGDQAEILLGDTAGFSLEAGAAEAISIQGKLSEAALVGDYSIQVDLVDATTSESLGNTKVTLHAITVETALAQYENKLIALSDEEISTIETEYATLDALRQTVKTAILGLKAEDQPALMVRYNAAAQNQYAAFKMIKQAQSAGNVLDLEKVTNVGGNLPFSILFRDTIKLGSASEAYLFYPAGYKAAQLKEAGYPDDEPDNITSKLVPDQTTWLVSNENVKGGDFLAVFKIANKWYKMTYTVSEDGKQLTKVNGIAISAPNQGDIVIIKKHTDKSALEAAIKNADDLIAATSVGKNVGQASKKSIDDFKAARDTAAQVKDSTPDYVDYSDRTVYDKLQKTLDDAKAALDAATEVFKEAIVSDVDYATEKVGEYETAAQAFFNSIRKKIRI